MNAGQHPPERERAREILHWIEQMRDPLWPGLSESDWAQLAEPVARAYLDLADKLAEAEQERERLRKVAHELCGFVNGGYGDSGAYAGTLRLIGKHADEALRPEGKPGDGEAEDDHALVENHREAREVEDWQERKHSAREGDG